MKKLYLLLTTLIISLGTTQCMCFVHFLDALKGQWGLAGSCVQEMNIVTYSKKRAQLWPGIFSLRHPIASTQEAIKNPVTCIPLATIGLAIGGYVTYQKINKEKDHLHTILREKSMTLQTRISGFFNYVKTEWNTYRDWKKNESKDPLKTP